MATLAGPAQITPAAAGPQEFARLRRAAFWMIVALMIQFTLGMIVNLFVTVPTNHPGAHPSEYFSGSAQSYVWAVTQGPAPLIAHVVWGTLLFVGSIALVVRAWPLHVRALRWASVLGMLLILAAGFNGASFLDFNEDFSSMLMAAFFALAVLSYASVLLAVPAVPL